MPKRVAISIKSKDGLDSLVDSQFGRAHAFLIVELETQRTVAQFFNDAASTSHGAGIAAAIVIKNNDIDAVISGRFGPKAVLSLQAYDIEMWTAPEGITAKEALDRLAAGSLEQMKVNVY